MDNKEEDPPLTPQQVEVFDKLKDFYYKAESVLGLRGAVINLVKVIQLEMGCEIQDQKQSTWKASKRPQERDGNSETPESPEKRKRLIDLVAALQLANDDLGDTFYDFQPYERFLSDTLWSIVSYRWFVEHSQSLAEQVGGTLMEIKHSRKFERDPTTIRVERLVLQPQGVRTKRGNQELEKFQRGEIPGWRGCLEDSKWALKQKLRNKDGRLYWQSGEWRATF